MAEHCEQANMDNMNEENIEDNLLADRSASDQNNHELLRTDHQQWHDAAATNEKEKEYGHALHCYLHELKLLCSRSVENEDGFTLCGQNIVRVGSSLTHVSDNIYKQDVFTQLYALGCSLHRHGKISEAINTLETAVLLFNARIKIQNPDSLNTDEILLMKVYFEIARCKEGNAEADECILDYRKSLGLAIKHKDVAFERMVSLPFLNLLMDKKMYADAAAGYLQLLALGNDIKETLVNDKLKYRAHWSLECECEVRYNLCVAFKALRLFDQALEEGLKFKKLLQIMGSWKSSKPKLKHRLNITHFMQINSLLGMLYETLGDLTSALLVFQEWQSECLDVVKSFPTDTEMQMELATAHQFVGGVLLKMRLHKEALDCFRNITEIGKSQKTPLVEVNGLLLQGDVLLSKGDLHEARNIFQQALKLAQVSIDDYSVECKCISKGAEVYSKEQRYDHALYQCERALHLGRKSDSNEIADIVERQAALYSQYSTSEKELLIAAKFFAREIAKLEEEIHHLKSEGVSHLKEEEKILDENYKAIQVILHRLGENKLSLAFGESSRRRGALADRKNIAQVPKVELKDFTQESYDENHVMVCEVNQLLAPCTNCTLITYTLCDFGFLAHVMCPGLKVTYSYLLSDHVVEPKKTMARLDELIQSLTGNGQKSFVERISTMYKTEDRSLPEFTGGIKVQVPLKHRNDAGDSDLFNQTVAIEANELTGKLPSEGITPVHEGEKVKKQELEKPTIEGDTSNPLRDLYSILLQPLIATLIHLPKHSHVCINPDGLLSKIPFDHLISPADGKYFGEWFNVTLIPNILVLDNCTRTQLVSDVKEKPATIRDAELRRTFTDPNKLSTLQQIGFDKSLSGIVSCTASGTNVITSSYYLTPYHQVPFFDKACVIGCPDFTTSVQFDRREWKPRSGSIVAQKECRRIGDILDVFPIKGEKATKTEFLSQMSQCSVIHICTSGSMAEGKLAFTPDSFPFETPPLSGQRYLVEIADLVACDPHNIKLAVLSAGHAWSKGLNHTQLKLPNGFLSAGVQCVVFPMWPVPDNVSETFYFHFYSSLQRSASVARALYIAKSATKARHPNPVFWNAFVVMGNDAIISLSKIRDAEIHRTVSLVESNKLTVRPVVETESSATESFHKLQQCLARFSGRLDLSRDTDVIPFLLGLIEEATDRLTRDENSDRPIVILPEAVALANATSLLCLLGFDFQNISVSSLPSITRSNLSSKGGKEAKMIIFPHWNQDGLLLPVHRALTGLHDICSNPECVRALSVLLPLNQDMLCKIIDLLALIYHTPQIQLKISDDALAKIWYHDKVRHFLQTIGVVAVRSLLVFYKTIGNKSLLLGVLQLLVSFCQFRDHNILEQLNVDTLGEIPKEEKVTCKNLESVNAVVMPRNEIFLKWSWMGDKSFLKEMKERKLLANEISKITEKYSRVLDHARWWHQDVTVPKLPLKTASGFLPENTETSPRRIKVKSGSTPSCSRIEIDDDTSSPAGLLQVLQRREEARYALHRRCVDLHRRHASALRSCYLPYTSNN